MDGTIAAVSRWSFGGEECPVFGVKPMWPEGFIRIPEDEDWVAAPIDESARQYDAVQTHGWYTNLDATLDELDNLLRDGDRVIDFSCGTGILVDRLLKRKPSLKAGFILVDASRKFLRLALDKLGPDPRTAFRLIRYLKDESRLQRLDEVLPESIRPASIDVVCSTNAIHLYYGLRTVLESWAAYLKPGGAVLIQSGNILNPDQPGDSWIIDNTVEALQPVAKAIVRDDDRFSAFRDRLDNAEYMARYDALRRKFFLEVRPLSYYLDALRDAGFEVTGTLGRTVHARVNEWADFLCAYAEGVLGWAGGSARLGDPQPSQDQLDLRIDLLRESVTRLFDNHPSFEACWTYIHCRKPEP